VPRVLLDDPLPDDLPLVFSCHSCNSGFSKDEEYVACLIDCVICGSADPAVIRRDKVRASLQHSPALATRIGACRTENAQGDLIWRPESERVRNVVVKLARAHIAHQYSEPQLDEPHHVRFLPLTTMTAEQRDAFEDVPQSRGWPEIGSRAFRDLLIVGGTAHDVQGGWVVLQRARYRYAVSYAPFMVRAVLSEYLACEVTW